MSKSLAIPNNFWYIQACFADIACYREIKNVMNGLQ